jgi:hypothetical protein
MDVLICHTIPPFRFKAGWQPMKTRSGASALFLEKNHTFCHPTEGFDIEKWNYGLILDPEQTKISTLPHTAASVSVPGRNRAWKK